MGKLVKGVTGVEGIGSVMVSRIVIKGHKFKFQSEYVSKDSNITSS